MHSLMLAASQPTTKYLLSVGLKQKNQTQVNSCDSRVMGLETDKKHSTNVSLEFILVEMCTLNSFFGRHSAG